MSKLVFIKILPELQLMCPDCGSEVFNCVECGGQHSSNDEIYCARQIDGTAMGHYCSVCKAKEEGYVQKGWSLP